MKKVFVFFGLMLLISLLVGSAYAIDMDSIIGIWKLDKGEGDVAVDSSGNGLDGVITGPTWVDGKVGKALSFDGEDDNVELPNNGMPDQYTVSVWVYPETEENMPGADGRYGRSVVTSSKPGKYGIWMTIDLGTNVRLYAFEDAADPAVGSFVTDSNPIRANTWNHIAATAIKGGESIIYVNGANVGSFTNAGKDGVTSEGFYLGDLRAGRKIAFKGIIDEVAIFESVLTANEIGTIMAQGLSALAVEPSGKLTTTWAGMKI